LHHDEWEAHRRGGPDRTTDPRRVLAAQIEGLVKIRLAAMGYAVEKQGHNAGFDLLACRDGQALRVEVKASTWNAKGRYQAQLRGNSADVLVMGCVNGDTHFFVIPFSQVAGTCSVDITSADVAEYHGKWAEYLEAWGLVDELAATVANPYQLELPLE
jgi:hypothetical protein